MHCGRELDKINGKYASYDLKYKQQLEYKVISYRSDCQERYLDTFTEKVQLSRVCLEKHTVSNLKSFSYTGNTCFTAFTG